LACAPERTLPEPMIRPVLTQIWCIHSTESYLMWKMCREISWIVNARSCIARLCST